MSKLGKHQDIKHREGTGRLFISLLPEFLYGSFSDSFIRKTEKKNKLLQVMPVQYKKHLEHFTKPLGLSVEAENTMKWNSCF